MAQPTFRSSPTGRAVAELLQFAFSVTLVTAIGFVVLESLAPRSVSPFLPLGTLIVGVVLLGFATTVLPSEASLPRRVRSKRNALAIGGFALISAIVLWARLRQLGPVSLALTALGVGSVLVLTLLLRYNGNDDERN